MRTTIKSPLMNRTAAISIAAVRTIAFLLLLTSFANAGPPKPTACTTSISACGCMITKSGTYTVTDDLASSQGLTKDGNCLEVNANHVILDLVGHAIIGTGTGIGILIRKSAHDTTVQGADLSEASQAVINSWNIGLEDDADNVVIEKFRQIGGNSFVPTGNAGDGVLLKNASGVTVANFIANFNGGTGVDVQGGSNNRIMNCSLISNLGNGVILASSNVNTISNCTIISNAGYGVWLNSANENQIFTSGLKSNGQIGLLVG